jgi:uncharacterized protein (TIGR02588 family)
MARRASPAAATGAGTSPLEWAVAAVGAALLVAAVGYLGWHGWTREAGPPDLVIEEVSRGTGQGGHRVAVRVRNVGREAAAQAVIGGELTQEGGRVAEEAETMLDTIAIGSAREAWLVFSEDPAGYTLRLRVKGMARP